MGIRCSQFQESSRINLSKLVCSSCKLHLSCGPIRITSNGTICGRCVAPEGGTHETLFESMLAEVLFPCRYKNFDCKTRLPFDTIAKHEDKCPNVPFQCPIMGCNWFGAQHQAIYHFLCNHSMNCSQISFTLDWNKDQDGFIINCDQSIPFLLRYDYCKTSRILNYDLCYFSNTALTATYKVKIENSQCNEINTTLRELSCLQFNPQKLNKCVIDLNKYLVALDNPDRIKFRFRIVIKKSLQPAITNTVKLDAIEQLRCNECHNYLSIPLYDSAIGTLCFDCSKNASTSRPSQNLDLQKEVSTLMFPCRWKKCSHVDTGDRIRQHELNCQYYLYLCPATGCKTNLIYKQMHLHLSMFHGMQLFNNRTSYKFFFDGSFTREFVTIKNNNVIVIKHVSSNKIQKFSLRAPENVFKIAAKFYLEHSHCNLKSKTYTIDLLSTFSMDREKLPKCFRTDEKLKLVIEI